MRGSDASVESAIVVSSKNIAAYTIKLVLYYRNSCHWKSINLWWNINLLEANTVWSISDKEYLWFQICCNSIWDQQREGKTN